MNYIVPDSAYKALKWLGLINAAGVLVGALLGISAATARPTDDD